VTRANGFRGSRSTKLSSIGLYSDEDFCK